VIHVKDWKTIGNWLHGPNGERVRSIAGAQGGAGGGTMQGAAGAGQNIDWTFGQKGVWDEKTERRMKLLLGLIGSNRGHSPNQGQSPGATPVASWDPRQAMGLMSFGGR
jgi:hypothetical protein